MNSIGPLSINLGLIPETKNEKKKESKNRLRSSSTILLKINPGSLSDFVHNNPPLSNSCSLKGLLSPRDLASIQNEICKPNELSPRQLDQLEKIKLLINSSYDFPTLKEIDQAMKAYYLQLLREINKKNKSKVHDQFAQILEKMCSYETPLVLLIKLHFDEFLPLLQLHHDSFDELKNLLSNITYSPRFDNYSELNITNPTNYLENLTLLLKKHLSTSTGAVLSFIIFGKNGNKLAELISLMEKWSQLDEKHCLHDLKKIKKIKVCEYWPPIEHSFDIEAIKRIYVTDKILPDKIFIDYMPLKLTGFPIDPNMLQEKFYRFFLKNIYQSWKNDTVSEITFEQIVTSFYKDNILPNDLRNVLGMSTFSAVWLALQCFHENFPALRYQSGSGLTSRLKKREDHAQVEICFNFKLDQPHCFREIKFMIYRGLNQSDSNSFVIAEDSPLAEISATFICKLAEQKINENETKIAHQGRLEIHHCHFIAKTVIEEGTKKETIVLNATSKQINTILEILDLPSELTNLSELTHLNVKNKKKLSDPLIKVKSLGKNFTKGAGKKDKSSFTSEKVTIIANPLHNLQKNLSN